METEVGTPQRSGISPLLANVYLHYALDLWVVDWRRQAHGDVIIVRYADECCAGVRKPGRSRTFAQGTARATAEGRTGTPPEDPTDRVRAIRRAESEAKRGRENPRRSIFWESRIRVGVPGRQSASR
jgi:RNA-directed DNA polymerase